MYNEISDRSTPITMPMNISKDSLVEIHELYFDSLAYMDSDIVLWDNIESIIYYDYMRLKSYDMIFADDTYFGEV